MKKITTHLTALSIYLPMALGSFAINSYAKSDAAGSEKTSPSAFLEAVQAEGESLFSKDGPAYIDDNGQIHIKYNQTTVAGIQSNEKAPVVADTRARIVAFQKRLEKAQEIYSSYSDSQKTELKNSNCASGNCGETNFLDPANDRIPEDGLCTKSEKIKIYKEVQSNPSCKNAPAKASCLHDFKEAFKASFVKMYQSFISGLKSGAAAVDFTKSKLFEKTKAPEQASSQAALFLSGMSKKQIEEAKKNPAAAANNMLENALANIGEFMFMLDVPMYKEMKACAKCSERANLTCKIMGVVGKDLVKYAIITYVTGKALNTVAGPITRALEKKAAAKAERYIAEKGIVAWEEKQTRRLSVRAANKFANFTVWLSEGKGAKGAAKKAVLYTGKGVVKLGKITMKAASIVDDTVIKAGDGAKKLVVGAAEKLGMKMPSRIGITGGRKVASEIAAIESRERVFESVPGLGKKAKVTAAETAELKEAKDYFSKNLPENFATDVDQVTRAQVKAVNSTAIRVDTKVGKAKFIEVPNAERVAKAYAYEDGRLILTLKDGSSHLVQDGKVISNLRPSKGKNVERLFTQEYKTTEGLATLEDAAPTSGSLLVEGDRPLTNSMAKSKDFVESKTYKGFADDIRNATETAVDPERVNSLSYKVYVGGEPRFISVPKGVEIEKAYHFGDGNRMIANLKGGKVALIEDGKIIKTIHENEAKKVEALLGKEAQASDEIAVQNARKNIEENGGTVLEENASHKNEVVAKTKKGCEPDNVTITTKAGL